MDKESPFFSLSRAKKLPKRSSNGSIRENKVPEKTVNEEEKKPSEEVSKIKDIRDFLKKSDIENKKKITKPKKENKPHHLMLNPLIFDKPKKLNKSEILSYKDDVIDIDNDSYDDDGSFIVDNIETNDASSSSSTTSSTSSSSDYEFSETSKSNEVSDDSIEEPEEEEELPEPTETGSKDKNPKGFEEICKKLKNRKTRQRRIPVEQKK